MRKYSVTQVAGFAGITVRTLHHYDEIGLLTPSGRTSAGYRLYGVEELQRLQQILLYRERGLSLSEIAGLLGPGAHDARRALQEHRDHLEMRIVRLRRMLLTVERTLACKDSGTVMLGREYFDGFSALVEARPLRDSADDSEDENPRPQRSALSA